MRLRTRLAPSPNGVMHTGHLLHLIHVFGIARKIQADIVYRMEDHDSLRCRPEYARQWREDLRWLGFTTGTDKWSVQSEHLERYTDLLDRLCNAGLVYACTCSRKTINERRAITGFSGGYDGYCRNRNHPFTDKSSLRLRLDHESLSFHDLRLGTQLAATEQGDPLLRDNRGLFTYQFCVVTDDIVEDVNLIIRGEDLLESTGQQLQMRRLFAPFLGKDYTDVILYHHPILYDEDGRKLSKSQQSLHLRALRSTEATPEELLGLAARQAGLTTARTLRAEDCADLFKGIRPGLNPPLPLPAD